MSALSVIANPDVRPEDKVHFRAARQTGCIAADRSVFRNQLLCQRREAFVVATDDCRAEIRDFDQRLRQIVIISDIRADFLCPACAERHVLIPDGTCVHFFTGILIEVQRGNEAVRVECKLLHQENLHKRISVDIVVIMLVC